MEPSEWRTGRNADLLRLLALHAGTPVPSDRLVAALWPRSDDRRGRASLRTAVSQLRRIVGEDHVERTLDGLVLRHAWVDVAAFRALAREARRHVAAGEQARALRVARQADALYSGQLTAHDTDAEWADTERQSLQEAHCDLLGLAAEAGLDLRWTGDAREYAARLVRIDPFSERAYRALMLANAGLGQTERALSAYHECRRVLADELGADPSAQTQAVYLQVLATQEPARPSEPAETCLVGRDDVMGAIDRLLADRCGDEVTVAAVIGTPGSGRTAVLAAVAARYPDAVVARLDPRHLDAGQLAIEQLDTGRLAVGSGAPGGKPGAPVLVVVDDADTAAAGSLNPLVERLARWGRCVVLLVAVHQAAVLTTVSAPVAWLPLENLDDGGLAELAADVLGGTPSPGLVRTLTGESGGRAGRATSILCAWTAAGRMVSTTDGLALMPAALDPEAGDEDTAHLLSRAREALPSAWHDVLDVAAVIGSPVRAALVEDVLGMSSQDVRAALDHLTDLSVLGIDNGVHHFRDPLVRDAAAAWLRPRARQDLHRRVARTDQLAPADRVEHFMAAGEVTEAAQVALDGAEQEVASGRAEGARDLVRMCAPLLSGAEPSDVPALRMRLHDVSARLDMWHGDDYDPPVPDDAVDEMHRRVLDELLPRRRVREAMDQAGRTGQLTDATLAAFWGAVLMGESASVRQRMEGTLGEGRRGRTGGVPLEARILLALAWHDLGDPRFRAWWNDLRAVAPAGEVPEWLAVRVAAERAEVDVAGLAALMAVHAPYGHEGRPLERHLMRLAFAEGYAVHGQRQAAVTLLDQCVSDAGPDGCLLLLPEAACRLAALLAGSDPVRAAELVDMALCSEGEESHPRERAFKLLAQARLRAVANRLDSAAELAAAADEVAGSAGLVFVRLDALTARVEYLRRAGRAEAATPLAHEAVGIAVAARADGRARVLRERLFAPAPTRSLAAPRLLLSLPRQRAGEPAYR